MKLYISETGYVYFKLVVFSVLKASLEAGFQQFFPNITYMSIFFMIYLFFLFS